MSKARYFEVGKPTVLALQEVASTIQWETGVSTNQALNGNFLESIVGWKPFQHPPKGLPNLFVQKPFGLSF